MDFTPAAVSASGQNERGRLLLGGTLLSIAAAFLAREDEAAPEQ